MKQNQLSVMVHSKANVGNYQNITLTEVELKRLGKILKYNYIGSIMEVDFQNKRLRGVVFLGKEYYDLTLEEAIENLEIVKWD
jgi:hypothetical protein